MKTRTARVKLSEALRINSLEARKLQEEIRILKPKLKNTCNISLSEKLRLLRSELKVVTKTIQLLNPIVQNLNRLEIKSR